MALEPSRLSEYRLFGSLGAGATSRVVEAVHIASNRRVAIKMLEVPEDDLADELRERFAREALVLSSLESRHVGKILGFGYEKGQPFLVLEHLQGESLDARLKREGPIPLDVFTDWVPQMIMGVRDFHAIGVIHRDLKPGNIFLQEGGGRAGEPVVKLIDFGLARSGSVQGSLTSKEHVLGSMGYMSPEQLQNPKDVAPQTDIYSLGCVIFRCLSGQLPFSSKSMEAVMKMKAEEDPPFLSLVENAPDIPELDHFVSRAIARRTEQRFSSAKEMLDAWWQLVPALTSAPSRDGDSIPITIDEVKDLDDEEVDSGWMDDKAASITHPPASPVPRRRMGDEPPTTIRGQTLADLVEQERAIAKRRRDSGEDI
ncbi:MAG: serine/threonine-protein kinase [Polyangiaceae bacterium]